MFEIQRNAACEKGVGGFSEPPSQTRDRVLVEFREIDIQSLVDLAVGEAKGRRIDTVQARDSRSVDDRRGATAPLVLGAVRIANEVREVSEDQIMSPKSPKMQQLSSRGRFAPGGYLAALACGAVMLVAGCGTTGDSAPGPTVPGSATRATATATAGAGESSASRPAPAEDVITNSPNTTAPAPSVENPSPTTASPAASVWDACSLSESALAAAGLDTASKARVPDAGNPAARVCKWQSADRSYELVVTASDRTIDDQLASGRYTDVRRTQYYGRDVAVYRAAQDTNKLGCYTGTPAAFGGIVFTVRNDRPRGGEAEPCAVANRLGAALFRSLP